MDRPIDGKTLLKRALRRRCPVCGQGAMFRSHFRINPTCPACHVTFWRDPGEVLGAMYLDWIAAMAAFLSLWALLAWLTNWSEITQLFILSAAACVAVISAIRGAAAYGRFWSIFPAASSGRHCGSYPAGRGSRRRRDQSSNQKSAPNPSLGFIADSRTAFPASATNAARPDPASDRLLKR